jgi:replicative DNA helicase
LAHEPNGLRNITPNPDEQQLPPHNVEAEQQLLGAILTNNDVFNLIAGMITADTFFDPVHTFIFQTITDMIGNDQLASPVTLKTAVETHPGVQELGGPRYLVRLAGAAISSHAAKDYALLMIDLKAKRELLAVCNDATQKIYLGREGASQISNTLEAKVGKVSGIVAAKPLIRSFLSAIVGGINQINSAYSGEAAIGVSTGLGDLDRRIGLMRPGNMILLGGRPSMGKTTLAQNIAYHNISNGVGVYYGSLEMTGEEMSPRFIAKGLAAQGTNISYSNMLSGNLSEGEIRKVIIEGQRQSDLPLILGERHVREIGRMKASVRRAQQHLCDTPTPLGLVIIDYLQLLASNTSRSSYDRVSEASDMCKSLAMDLEVPVVALAQLSRNVEQRDPPVPMLADLRESGKLEEDADVVLFCYRDAYYLRRKLDAVKGDISKEADYRMALAECEKQMDIIIAKQRSGATGTARAFVDMATCHVTSDQAHQDDRLI